MLLGEDVALDEIEYLGEKDEEVERKLDEANVVFLTGSHGTGKTTTAYRVCQRLEARGYEVRIPTFGRNKDVDYIEHALNTTAGRNVAYASYNTDPGSFHSPEALEHLFEWADDGTVEMALVEIRTEQFDQLKAQLNNTRVGGGSRSNLLSRCPKVEFDRWSDGDRSLVEVIEWTLAAIGAELDEDVIDDVREWADGNPEIAKLTTRMMAEEDLTIADKESPIQIVWEDVRSLVGEDEEVRHLVSVLSATGTTTTSELADVLDSPEPSLFKKAKRIRGYLGAEVRRVLEGDGKFNPETTWTISPSIYRRAIFEYEALGRGASGQSHTTVKSTVQKLDWFDPDHRYEGVARALGGAYEDGDRWDVPDLRETARERSNWFLEFVDDAEPEPLIESILFLVLASGVPVETTVLKAEREKVIEGAQAFAGELEMEADAALLTQDLLGALLANNVRTGDSSAASVSFEYATTPHADPAEFLENVYSMAVKKLAADFHPGDERIEAWVDRIDQLARNTATKRGKLPDVDGFLGSYRAYTAARVSEDDTPTRRGHWHEYVMERATADSPGTVREFYLAYPDWLKRGPHETVEWCL